MPCGNARAATTYIIAHLPSQYEGIPYLEWECAKREAHLKRCRRSSYRYIAYTLGTDYFLTLTILFQLIGPLCSNDIPRN